MSASLISALENTNKGKLVYDTTWKEDGRTEEIVNLIEQSVSSISLSPKINISSGSVDNSIISNGDSVKNNDVFSHTPHIKSNSTFQNGEKSSSINISFGSRNKSFSVSPINLHEKLEIDLIKAYEQERSEKIAKRNEEYTNKLLEKNENLIENVEGEVRLIQKKYLLKAIQHQHEYQEECTKLEKELEQHLVNSKNEQNSSSFNKGASLKLKEFEEKQKLFIKQKENQRLRQIEFRQTIINCKEYVNKIIQECEQYQQQSNLKVLGNIKDELKHFKTLLLGLVQDLDLLLTKNEFVLEDVQFAHSRKEESNVIKQKFFNYVQQQLSKTTLVLKETKAVPQTQPISQAAKQPANEIVTKSNLQSKLNVQFTDPVKNIYVTTQLKLLEIEEKCSLFSQNISFKKRRGDLQRFVRTTINQVCNQPVGSLREKAIKLVRLLSGQAQEDRNVLIQCQQDDNSLYFAMNDAAKSFLNVTVKQKNMAIKLAPVVAYTWARVPLFGTIFLSQLFRNCPYAIPYYPAQDSSQSELEFMVTCGYQINSEGQITESNEMFLERMFAMLQLYSAVIQCNITQGHPRDLQYAWNWLARVLSDSPRPRTTAMMLDAVLSVSAHKLFRIYGKQFVKLIRYIKNVYLKKIESITTTEKQTMMKFTTLIEEIYRIMNRNGNTARELAQRLDLVPDHFFL